VAIAFFDLDRTLIASNSAVLWLRSELRLGNISRLKALLASVWVARYHLGFAGRGEGLRHAIGSLAGSPESALRERTVTFYDEFVRGLYRPGARSALQSHREAGDRLALLTSSSNYMGELVARDLGLDAVLCNRFEVGPDGIYTGRPQGELCYGVGKLAHAREYAGAEGFELSLCTFYTDSYADVPLMHEIGRPVAVNPDLRLRRMAAAHGWEIVDWGVPRIEPLMSAR
jgi:HAD superfamily hydrolase (TIGR01490 family)